MKERDDRFYVLHILECIGNIEHDTAAGKEFFIGNRTYRDAVLRNLQILAESSTRIEAPFQARHPEIPWREVARFRNVAVHDYLDIDYDEVWLIVTEDLPELKRHLTRIAADLERPHS
ncbi:MAG TPA: DUF86 domain-containing protein [Thermoanaerobaculia bacterium]|nr:DUF86 domain-containing protein [Thermoanaerobaculia bacterium]